MEDRMPKLQRIRDDATGIGGDLKFQAIVMDLEKGLDRRHGIVDQFHDLDLRVRDLEVVILVPRQIEDIVHQGIELPARSVVPGQVGGSHLTVGTGSVWGKSGVVSGYTGGSREV